MNNCPSILSSSKKRNLLILSVSFLINSTHSLLSYTFPLLECGFSLGIYTENAYPLTFSSRLISINRHHPTLIIVFLLTWAQFTCAFNAFICMYIFPEILYCNAFTIKYDIITYLLYYIFHFPFDSIILCHWSR